jgi:sigma-E factor negative regulatory protein RseC
LGQTISNTEFVARPERVMICQRGKVISANDKSVNVRIVSSPACDKCSAHVICNASEPQGKIINAFSHESLHVGDSVLVKIEDRLGKIAILYAFVIPFIVMVSILFTAHAFGATEIKAAIFALITLPPYYVCLYFFRKKIEKDFIFIAEKMQK